MSRDFFPRNPRGDGRSPRLPLPILREKTAFRPRIGKTSRPKEGKIRPETLYKFPIL